MEKQENLNKIKQFFKDVGFKLLLNVFEIIKINNEKIAIIGVKNWRKAPFKLYGHLKLALKSAKNIPFKILLSHNPSHWNDKVIININITLTLSGHTHGMQLGFNYKNMTWSPIKYKHWAVLSKHNHQYLYVNIGLGWIGFLVRLAMCQKLL